MTPIGFRCTSCAHLMPLMGDVFTCVVVNIRLHRTFARLFACNQYERRRKRLRA